MEKIQEIYFISNGITFFQISVIENQLIIFAN